MLLSKRAIAKAYIQYLDAGNLEDLLSLFAPEAKVDSPIYQSKSASDFYQMLFQDTRESELELKGIFEDSETGELALYFNYQWTLKDGGVVNFDVVDILHFDEEHRITYLKIIYDTVQSRPAVAGLND